MALKNTQQTYGSMSIALHWLMAIMIMGLILVGFFMSDLDDSPQKFQIYGLHKATGFIVLLLALFRWYWTLSNPKPLPLDGWSHGETAMAHASKWLLMLLMLVMPFSGLLMSVSGGHNVSVYGLFTIPGFDIKNDTLNGIGHKIHELGGYAIALVVSLHLLAALKHHLIRKDNTLNRMLGKTE